MPIPQDNKSHFLTWLKSVEEAWGKVSASVTQVIAKLRSNLRTDENDLRMLLSEKMNERLFSSLSDKVGGTLKKTVWPNSKSAQVQDLLTRH